jgi:hypothetical protein
VLAQPHERVHPIVHEHINVGILLLQLGKRLLQIFQGLAIIFRKRK